jgi:hypothetical protein
MCTEFRIIETGASGLPLMPNQLDGILRQFDSILLKSQLVIRPIAVSNIEIGTRSVGCSLPIL